MEYGEIILALIALAQFGISAWLNRKIAVLESKNQDLKEENDRLSELQKSLKNDYENLKA